MMSGSRETASASVSEVERARGLLDEIQGVVGGIQDRTHRIATAAEEQSRVSADLDGNVVRIADLAGENAKGAELITVASAQLDGLAREIGGMIDSFRTA